MNENERLQMEFEELSKQKISSEEILSRLEKVETQLEGLKVDEELSSASTNLVKNKTVTGGLNDLSMCPTENNIYINTAPVEGQVWFCAPSNGVCYIRICPQKNGFCAMHLQNLNGSDLCYNTRHLTTSGDCFDATFVMAKGQRIFCYEIGCGFSWGELAFVPSKAI